MKDVEITVKGENKNYLEIVEKLAEISKMAGCNFSFVSANPGLYVNPEIYVPDTHVEKFKEQLESVGMLFDAKEAYQETIEQLKNKRN
jgi:hypothetical protein